MNIRELKSKAKESLKGKYGDAIALMIIPTLIGFAVSLIVILSGLNDNTKELINSIITIAVTGLFGFGTTSYYLKVSRNESVTYKELFSKMNMFRPYLAVTLLVGLFTTLWSFLFLIPGIIAAISYSMVYYIKLDNPELSTKEIIAKSKKMMHGHKWNFVVLNLSFIGWEILGVFTLGILYIWLVPYVQVTNANFYNKLKEEQNTL